MSSSPAGGHPANEDAGKGQSGGMEMERETGDTGEQREGWEPAVLDRFVDGHWAVLLVGPAEAERVVPRSELPAGVGEGAWLRTGWDGDRLLWAEVDPEATRLARERIAAKLARLRQRGRNPG
ncbi:MAG TPA: DUF3006 domain-containing protein [Limnochordales bacterium]